MRNLACYPSRYFFAQEHRIKDPGQCRLAGVLDRTLGHWGPLKTPETAREETPMVAQISQGRAWGLSKIEHSPSVQDWQGSKHAAAMPISYHWGSAFKKVAGAVSPPDATIRGVS